MINFHAYLRFSDCFFVYSWLWGAKRKQQLKKERLLLCALPSVGPRSRLNWQNKLWHNLKKKKPWYQDQYGAYPQGHPTKMMTMIAGGTAPDVGCVEISPFTAWAHKAVLENLEPYVAESKVIKLRAFWTYVLGGGTSIFDRLLNEITRRWFSWKL